MHLHWRTHLLEQRQPTPPHLAVLPAAPLDWSLKTTVRFASPSAFSIADEAAFLGGAAVVQAHRAFTSGEGVHSLSMQQRYLAALHSWQFPADPRAGPAGGGAKPRGVPPEAAARRCDWQTAFASLYGTLRSGACDAFYYLSPEVGAGMHTCCGGGSRRACGKAQCGPAERAC